MSAITVTVIEIDEQVSGDTVTVLCSDGSTVALPGDASLDTSALKPGSQYSIAFVPFVAPSAQAAIAGATAVAPTSHPVVLCPVDAKSADAALPSQIIPGPVPAASGCQSCSGDQSCSGNQSGSGSGQ